MAQELFSAVTVGITWINLCGGCGTRTNLACYVCLLILYGNSYLVTVKTQVRWFTTSYAEVLL